MIFQISKNKELRLNYLSPQESGGFYLVFVYRPAIIHPTATMWKKGLLLYCQWICSIDTVYSFDTIKNIDQTRK